MYLHSTPHHKREVCCPFQSLIDLISGESCAGTDLIGGFISHAPSLRLQVKKKPQIFPKIVSLSPST